MTRWFADARYYEVFLVTGQSNARGRGDNFQVYTGSTGRMRREDSLYALMADPTDSDENTFGTPWPLVCDLLEAETGLKFAFFTAAEGATGLVNPTDWQQGGAEYNTAVGVYQGGNPRNLTAFLWYQGETDAGAGVSAADYQTALSQMLDDFQDDLAVDAPMICAMLGTSGATDDQVNTIRAAHVNRWENDADIYPGPVGHDQDFADGTHWTTDAQMLTLAQRWARTILTALYGSGESARGPQFSTATYGVRTVTVTFTGGEGALQNQTDTNGWEVTDDNGDRTITSATGTDDTVTLTLDQSLVAPIYVSFCSGNECQNGAATLCDSGTYSLPPEPIVSEQAYPWWDPLNDGASIVAAYQAISAADYAASKVNLANPGTYDITDTTPPSWTIGAGWTFDGSTEFLNTNLAMSDLDQLNAVGIVKYSLEDSPYNHNRALFGQAYTTEASGYDTIEFAIYHDIFESWYWIFGQYNLNGVYQGGSPAYTGANMLLDGGDCYIDGTYQGTCSAVLTWIADGSNDIYIGAIHNYVLYIVGPPDDYPSYFWKGTIEAVAFYDTSLTEAQRNAIIAAMETL